MTSFETLRSPHGRGHRLAGASETPGGWRRDAASASGMIQRVRCPGCGSATLEPLGRYRTQELPLDLALCGGCGLVFVNPMLTDAAKNRLEPDVRRLHRSRSAELTDESALARSRQRAARWAQVIASHLRPGSRVLDVGAGDGALIELLLAQGHQPVALDPDPATCAFLRRRFNIETFPSRIEDVDAGALGTFDAVFLLNLIEHLEDPGATLDRIAQRLRPGGLLAIETPNILRTKVGPKRMFSLPHNYYFSPSSLLTLVAGRGFHPVHGRVFHRDMFHLTLRLEGSGARCSVETPAHAAEVRRAIRSHGWRYYLGAQFLLRKLPIFRRWYLYGRFQDLDFEPSLSGNCLRLAGSVNVTHCLLSLLGTVPV